MWLVGLNNYLNFVYMYKNYLDLIKMERSRKLFRISSIILGVKKNVKNGYIEMKKNFTLRL